MATTPITDPNHPLLAMVRSSSVVLSDLADEAIFETLNRKVMPRIRLAFVNAKNANSSNEGINVFLGANRSLADLADAAVQSEIDGKIDQIVNGTMMSEMIDQIAANMAAGYLAISQVGVVEQFYKTGMDLISRADKDLKELVEGPLFKEAVRALVDSKASDFDRVVTIYLSHEADETSYDPVSRTIQAHAGAQQNGLARLWVGTVSFTTPIGIGDTATDIIYNLIRAYRAEQLNREAADLPLMNVAFGVNDGALQTVITQVPVTTLAGTSLASANLVVPMPSISVHGLAYDPGLDAQMVTLEIGRDIGGSFVPGLDGLVYGVESIYSRLTKKGPHSVLIDLQTGKTTAAAAAKTQQIKHVYDTLYFRVEPEPALAELTFTGALAAGETMTLSLLTSSLSLTAPAGGLDAVEAVQAWIAKLSTQQAQIELGGMMLKARAGDTPDTLTLAWAEAAAEGKTVTITATDPGLTTDGPATFTGYAMTDVLRAPGQFRYRTGHLYGPQAAPAQMVRTVPVPGGTTVMAALQLLCDDIYRHQDELHLLSALRSPVLITPQGTPVSAPSIQFVPFLIESTDSRIVVDLLESPPELLSAARPLELITSAGLFDAKAKSLVLEPVVLRRAGEAANDPTTNLIAQATAQYAAPKETPLQAQLKRFQQRRF